MKKKQVIGLLLVIAVIIINLIPTNVLAVNTLKLTITPNITEANPGDQITYTVKMSAVQNLGGIKFKLNIPKGLTFVEGSIAEGIKSQLHAQEVDFFETTKVFAAGSCSYSSNLNTVLMTFKCVVDSEATGNKEITFIIDEDDIIDTNVNNISNIPVDYSNPGSTVSINGLTYTNLEVSTVENVDDKVINFNTKTTFNSILTSENFPVLNNNYIVKLFDSNGVEKNSTAKLGSRNVIKIIDNNENVVTQYLIIVKGDVTGNGEVKIYDAFKILVGVISNSETLDEIEVLIRDYNNDGQVRLFDAINFLVQAIQ